MFLTGALQRNDYTVTQDRQSEGLSGSSQGPPWHMGAVVGESLKEFASRSITVWVSMRSTPAYFLTSYEGLHIIHISYLCDM
jgi:hypothetical protein